MIELPEIPSPDGAEPSLIDFGVTLQPPLGGGELRLNRMGSRYRIGLSWPAMRMDLARIFISRLQQAKSDGLRVAYPLLDVPQGSPGAPVVNAVAPSGTTLPIRGINPGYMIKEGYWLSIEDASGQHYLHNARAAIRVGATGIIELPIWPMLRTDFADGATIHLAKPMIEGLPEGEETGWALTVDHLVRLAVTIRETG